MAGVPFKKGVAVDVYTTVTSQSDTTIFQANPTIAAGDFQVSIDGGALNNLTTLPSVSPAASKQIKIELSAAEMNGDVITIIGSDQAGAEWYDVFIQLFTSDQQIDDLTACLTAGAIEYTYTVTNTDTGDPIPGVQVWFTTDLAGTNVIWSGTTDAFGVARDACNQLPWLDAGTYYAWKQKVGLVDDDNPDTEVVS